MKQCIDALIQITFFQKLGYCSNNPAWQVFFLPQYRQVTTINQFKTDQCHATCHAMCRQILILPLVNRM